MAHKDEFGSLARTLCHNPHKSVLLKNAFQCQQTLPKHSGTLPRLSVMDITLFSGSGIKSRGDLQPVNDPFIVDNIFKSPKKRRRGLLSWSAMPVAEVSAYAERQGLTTPLWDFPRHMRARNRRRSILGSKCSLSSMRRRRVWPNAGGEHSRSISDPTTAIIGISPISVAARGFESNTSTLHVSLSDKSQSPCPSSPKSTPSSIATIKPPRKHRRLRSFPKLSDVDTPPPAVCRRSGTFFDQPALPAPVSATLRGVPGHPAKCALQSRAPPYISVSALRLVSSDACCGVREPAPALLRPESLRTLRCSSLPSVVPPKPNVLRPPAAPRPAFVQWPPRHGSGSLAATKFAGVKNSLEIRRPAPLASQTMAQEQVVTPAKQAASRDEWPLPSMFTLLRRFAACGGRRRR